MSDVDTFQDDDLYLAPDVDRNLRRLLVACGLMEIGLFGLPLIAAGRWIGRFVRCYDPHIFKEYGVARVAIGVLFLLGARKREARAAVAVIGTVFYSLNLFTSVVDLVLGNVARLEYLIGVLSAILAALLSRPGTSKAAQAGKAHAETGP